MPQTRAPNALIAPVVAVLVAVVSTIFAPSIAQLPGGVIVWPVIEFVVLGTAVFAAIHHADIIAHRTGEPYGTLVLTVAVTVIEVALIVSIMLSGDGSPTLARDTVFAVVMVVCNGLVGLCIIVGGLKYGEQGFRLPGANAYLVVLMPLATLTLILPNATTSVPGPFYTMTQLGFVTLATIVLYGVFLYVQAVRHRDYFLSDPGKAADHDGSPPTNRDLTISVVMLIAALVGVVLLAKHVAETVKIGVTMVGAPMGAVGLLVAILVLMPESLAAIRAARNNQLQKSLNLALGSSLATIGMTIPAVAIVSVVLATPLGLGLDNRDLVLLILTFGVSLVTFGGGRTNILPGFVHLVLFATYVFLIFAP